MDKYEYRVKTEQLLEYTEHKEYRKAMEIADTIDWRRVKSTSMLNTVSEIYEYCGEYKKSRDILFMAFDRAPGSRKIVYRLGTLALKVNDPDEASDCYEEFVKLAPKDPNQYILKYKIQKAQGAPLQEQIETLEEFKKAEYIEKWAYELANLYHQAGMVSECIEECDDLILWFSEGKYVRMAMELKMKYKPLTPLQQEKYEGRSAGVTQEIPVSDQDQEEAEEKAQEEPVVEESAKAEPESVQEESVAEVEPEAEEEPEEESEESVAESEAYVAGVAEEILMSQEEEKAAEVEPEAEEEPESVQEKPVAEGRPRASITRVVTGATFEEALASGVAMAAEINQEEKAMADRDEELRISGQMKIEEILQEWEEKQKMNADAIEKQKAEDQERLRKEREEAEKRMEADRRAVEEAARKAQAEAARKAQEEAAKKAAEEAARKAAEEAARKAAEEEAARKAAEEAARKAAEEAAKKAAEEAARKAAEEEAARKAAEEEAAKKAAEEAAAKKAAEEEAARKMLEQLSGIKEPKKDILEEKTQRLPDDILELVEQLESRVAATSVRKAEKITEEDLEDESDEDEFTDRDFVEGEFDEDFEESDFVEDEFDEDEFVEDELDEDDLTAEAFEEEEPEEDFEEEGLEDAGFRDDYEEDFEEAEFEDDYEEDFEEAELEDDYEEDFEEAEFEDDYEEDFEEAEFEDDYEEDFEEAEFEEADEEDFEEEEFEEAELEEADDEPLEIEEPSEEEIQKRFNKAKGGGVPFDTGFVVTGRYDLSATSEIGLKAGLTEEQKKLFSYFVPVRGMSEQIVEVLDNDRRAIREGTSKTGNLLVIGRKGSGKTVLAVDIVKAIQKQRNLKQGKVAIVTGESLNKKELPNIIQKLRGGAIIVEKAGKLNSRTVKELNHLMERKTGEMLFVLEDQRKPLEKMLMANPEFKKKFTSKLELPIFINDELVTFGQTYAKENGYKLDEMGILALYSRIDVMQREDHAVSVAEVKEIMDEAISHSQRANVKHLARRVFGKGTDESDRIILKEEDFKI